MEGIGRFERTLVLEDDWLARRALMRAASRWSDQVIECETVAGALGHLSPALGLVLADVCLPDGTAHAVFESAADLVPPPVLVAFSGQAGTRQAFELAQMGAGAFLTKPFSESELEHAVGAACAKLQRASLASSGEHTALVAGAPKLGGNERLLLAWLIRYRGRWVSAREIAREALQREDPAGENLAWQYMHRLRRWLRATRQPHAIESKRGLGYRLITPPSGS